MSFKGKVVRLYAHIDKVRAARLACRMLGLDTDVFDAWEEGKHPRDDDGKFTSGNGSSGSKGKSEGSEGEKATEAKAPEAPKSKFMEKMAKHRQIALKWDAARQAEHLFDKGFLTEDEAIEAMNNGTAKDRINDYFDLMEYNGDPTPTKPLRKSPNLWEEVEKEGKHGGDYEQARKDYIKEWTGMSDEETEETYQQFKTWFSFGNWTAADTDTLDRYIDADGAYGGEIYRGMHFSEDDYAAFMKGIVPGARIGMNGHNSSWATDRETAWTFCRNGDRQVIITCKNNKTSAPVDHLSTHGENEVLAHSRTQWTVIGVREGDRRTEITVMEAEARMSPEERDRRKAAFDSEPDSKEESSLAERMNGQTKFMTILPPPADLFKHRKSEAEDGGPGSGNFGHKGRPGKRGGSGEGGGKGFRAASKESKSGYVGIQRAAAFKGIARLARTHKDNYNAWINSLSSEQRDQLEQQHKNTGSKEDLGEYAERMHRMLSTSNPPRQKHQNAVVQGKDITETCSWDDEPYTEPKFGQVIDTEIEHVINQQGFNGVPKVVTQKEFDKITQEHPEMPILLRSYAAPNAETLQAYDEMLENGEWYVDCGTGGAQYGQGMYAAGVYKTELASIEDLDEERDIEGAIGALFGDSNGRAWSVGYKASEEEINGGLYVGQAYLIVDKEGNRRLMQIDNKSYNLKDLNTGEEFEDTDAVIENAKTIRQCIREDEHDVDRAGKIEAAVNEMRHYRGVNERRIYNEYKPPMSETEDCEDNGRDGIWIWDENKMTHWSDEEPKDGQEIAVKFPFRGGVVRTGIYKDGRLVYPGGLASTSIEDNEDCRWAPIERKDNREDLRIQAATRMMTLDPSAKILKYSDLQALMNGDLTESETVELYNKMRENGFKPGTMEYGQEYQRLRNEMLEKGDRKQFYEKIKHFTDMGSAAAALGYDAINAEGHGSSGSYMVILNRTKLIISEQRVDVD